MNLSAIATLWVLLLIAGISLPWWLIARSLKYERDWLRQIAQTGVAAKARVVSIKSERLASGGGGAVLQSKVEVEFVPTGSAEPVRAIRTFSQSQSVLPWREVKRHPAVEAIVTADWVDIHHHPKWPTMIAFDHEV